MSIISSVSEFLITEALATTAQKSMARKASKSTAGDRTAAQNISDEVFGKEDRVTIPLNRNMSPDPLVANHLKSHGYTIKDYSAGLASHESTPDRNVKIGRILHQIEAPDHINRAYQKDPARTSIKNSDSNMSIVISRNPHDVAAMSTHQNWQSCQTLGSSVQVKDADGNMVTKEQAKGTRTEYVPTTIASGAHIAYLVNDPKDVDTHYGPKSRTTLNVFVSDDGSHRIIRPSETYGDKVSGFHSTVKSWAEKNFPALHPWYVRHDGAYPEGEQTVEDYSERHNDYWKQNPSNRSLETHFNPSVVEHYVSHSIDDNDSFNANHLIKNKNLSDEQSDRLISHFGKQENSAKVMARSARTSEQVGKVLVQNPDSFRVASAALENDNIGSSDLHHVIDKFGAAEYAPGKRKLVHNGMSPEILQKAMENKTVNETHMDKVLSLYDFSNDAPPHLKEDGFLDHIPAINAIAKKYHSEEIGKKVVATFPTVGRYHSKAIAAVAEKHPHLLIGQSDHAMAHALYNSPSNKNLEKLLMDRGTNEAVNAVSTMSRNLDHLTTLASHPDPMIAHQAKHRIFQLQRDKNDEE